MEQILFKIILSIVLFIGWVGLATILLWITSILLDKFWSNSAPYRNSIDYFINREDFKKWKKLQKNNTNEIEVIDHEQVKPNSND